MTELARLEVRDTYTDPLDPDYARKGQRFRAERVLPKGRKLVVYGTFDMDGLAVSSDYGWMRDPSRLDSPYIRNQPYINVKLDHKAYTPSHPNDSIYYQRDIWTFYVTSEVAWEAAAEVRKGERIKELKVAQVAVLDLEEGVEGAEEALEASRTALAVAFLARLQLQHKLDLAREGVKKLSTPH